MNTLLWYFISVGIGFCLCCIWLGFQIGITSLANRFHWNIFPGLSNAVAAIPALLITIALSGKSMLRIRSLLDGISWIIIICTVLLTIWIVSYFRYTEEDILKTKVELLSSGLNGLLMEVPQRWMMQTALLYLLSFSKIEHIEILSTLATATV